MTQLFGVLTIGTTALLAQQRGINVTGNNIANVNTPGYSRQRLDLQSVTPVDFSVGALGGGVRAAGVERVYDRFLGAQLNAGSAQLGRWEAQSGMLQRVEVIFDESSGYGLNQALSQFWSSWQDLGMNPSGPVERTVVTASGQALADAIRKKHTDLLQTQKDIDTAIAAGIVDINKLTAEIADLNQKIAHIESGGVKANDFRDSRELALQQLAELVEFDSFEDGNGQVMVSVGAGRGLVESGTTYRLAVSPNAEGRFDVMWLGIGSGANISAEIGAGKLGGWLQTRDVKIGDYLGRLDELAAGLIREVNALHAGGFALDTSTGNGFFDGSSAADMRVAAGILADPNRIAAAASAAGVPGDPGQAIAIADLRQALKMNANSATFDTAANSIVSLVGHDVRESKSYVGHQADMLTYLKNYRESVSGVSLDEEMVNLLKYQTGYEAAAKLISLADEMMDSLMNIIR
jgi:flagellar hook-associated protein 1 FlgK